MQLSVKNGIKLYATAFLLSAAGVPSSPESSTTEIGRSRTIHEHHHEHHWGPFFEVPINSTISTDNSASTAHLFTEAVLNCRVGMLKDKTVMWVKRTAEKVSLLTVGNITYSGDPRIRVTFRYPNNWRLIIKPTRMEDSGVYMCQVSTHPPRVFTANLTILEPPLRIIDDQKREVSDRFYKTGSTIDLQCEISKSFLLKKQFSIMESIKQDLNVSGPSDISERAANKTRQGINEPMTNWNRISKEQFEMQYKMYFFWRKDDRPITGQILKISRGPERLIKSYISIADAKLTDSGNYSCSIGKLFKAIVLVHVLSDKLPAAVQQSSALSDDQRMNLLHSMWIPNLAVFIYSSSINYWI